MAEKLRDYSSCGMLRKGVYVCAAFRKESIPERKSLLLQPLSKYFCQQTLQMLPDLI